jgi:hypothetical protein
LLHILYAGHTKEGKIEEREEALSESVVPTAEKVSAPKQEESEPEAKNRAVDS